VWPGHWARTLLQHGKLRKKMVCVCVCVCVRVCAHMLVDEGFCVARAPGKGLTSVRQAAKDIGVCVCVRACMFVYGVQRVTQALGKIWQFAGQDKN